MKTVLSTRCDCACWQLLFPKLCLNDSFFSSLPLSFDSRPAFLSLSHFLPILPFSIVSLTAGVVSSSLSSSFSVFSSFVSFFSPPKHTACNSRRKPYIDVQHSSSSSTFGRQHSWWPVRSTDFPPFTFYFSCNFFFWKIFKCLPFRFCHAKFNYTHCDDDDDCSNKKTVDTSAVVVVVFCLIIAWTLAVREVCFEEWHCLFVVDLHWIFFQLNLSTQGPQKFTHKVYTTAKGQLLLSKH